MSASEESSSSSSEDEEFLLNEQFERDFLKTLSLLKKKDPSIYDENTTFFSDNATIATTSKPKKGKKTDDSSKPLTIAEYEKKIYFDTDNIKQENDIEKPTGKEPLSYVEEQREIKESFKQFLSDDEVDDSDNLLKVRVKTTQEKEQEEADYIQWMKGQINDLEDKETKNKLKPLHDYWNSNDLDQNEVYLRDFILNKRFLDEEKSESEEEPQNEGGLLSDDSAELNEIDDFEQKFNLRFESEESHADLIKRYPRTVEGSLRRKNEKRKNKRAEIKERKDKDKRKKRDEINKQKNLKSKEITERLEELKRLTGNEKLAFKDEDIMEDFDSDVFDKKMSQMYNDEFYSMEDSEKPQIDDIEGLDQYDDDEGGDNNAQDHQDFDMDCESGPSYREKKLTRTKKKKKDKKKKSFTDFTLQENKPLFDPKLHESYDKFMDEYYQLDCEDFIGDMPTRYKYKSVVPNDFGLTVDEILVADEKELNRWSSAKKLTKIRPNHVEKNEAMIYKMKAQNVVLKKKILPSLFETEESKDQEDDKEDTALGPGTSSETVEPTPELPKKKRKPWYKPGGNPKKPKFQDSRLAAYGINPSKFNPK